MLKQSPFSISNNGASIDDKFFLRLKHFENAYQKQAAENELVVPNYHAIKSMNSILQQETLSTEEIKEAITIYNEVNANPHHNGSAWFDLMLHIKQLAFVYGLEYAIDLEFSLVLSSD